MKTNSVIKAVAYFPHEVDFGSVTRAAEFLAQQRILMRKHGVRNPRFVRAFKDGARALLKATAQPGGPASGLFWGWYEA